MRRSKVVWGALRKLRSGTLELGAPKVGNFDNL